jgi:hypothetical protein
MSHYIFLKTLFVEQHKRVLFCAHVRATIYLLGGKRVQIIQMITYYSNTPSDNQRSAQQAVKQVISTVITPLWLKCLGQAFITGAMLSPVTGCMKTSRKVYKCVRKTIFKLSENFG